MVETEILIQKVLGKNFKYSYLYLVRQVKLSQQIAPL